VNAERRPEGRPARTLAKASERSVLRRSSTEEDFHTVDGWPYAGRVVRRCIGCGAPEPHQQLRVREADGAIGWRSVPDAVRRGGR
jgi:hypothetical protein